MSRSAGTNSTPSVEELRQRLQRTETGYPIMGQMSLRWNAGAMKMCVMKEAWEESTRDPDNPGQALQLYFPEKEVLLVDLS